MTKEELAALLNGRQYGSEITKNEEVTAKAAGLVVIFGYSDDLVELRGAISDELGAYGGTRLTITAEGALPDWDSVEHSDKEAAREYFRQEALPREVIDCEWAPANESTLSWSYTTKMPHATFEVMEDGDVYCRGIVISLADITPIPV